MKSVTKVQFDSRLRFQVKRFSSQPEAAGFTFDNQLIYHSNCIVIRLIALLPFLAEPGVHLNDSFMVMLVHKKYPRNSELCRYFVLPCSRL